MAGTPLSPGRILGQRYRIVRLLGQGGMGAVYEAVQEDLGRRVAVKVLHNADEGDAIERFQREARAAAALGHPNIVQVTDFQWPTGEPPFLVMEFFDGQSLGDLLKHEQRLAGPRVAFIATQMLDALAAAHRAGIVHRDIKPDNVQLVSISGMNDIVKLVDFGVAKLEGQGGPKLTAQGAAIGSPAFMAPEQVSGAGVDPRTDLYAVGVTMYRAISGQPLFDATTLPDLYQSILHREPKPLVELAPDCNPSLAAVVTRALSKDPRGRFLNAEAFKTALEPFAVGSSTRASAAPAIATLPSAQPLPFAAATPSGYPNPAARSYAPQPMPVTSMAPGGFNPNATQAPTKSSSGPALGCLIGGGIVGLGALVVAAGALVFLLSKPTATSTAVDASSPVADPGATAAAPSSNATTATTTDPSAARPGGALVIPGKGSAKPISDAGTAPTPVVVVDAGGPPPLKRYAARSARLSGGSWTNEWELEHSRGKVQALVPSINGCFSATEYTPPNHQSATYNLAVSAAGKVTNSGPPPGATAPRCAPLDTCVNAHLKSIDFGPTKSKKPTEVQVSFFAELPWNEQP